MRHIKSLLARETSLRYFTYEKCLIFSKRGTQTLCIKNKMGRKPLIPETPAFRSVQLVPAAFEDSQQALRQRPCRREKEQESIRHGGENVGAPRNAWDIGKKSSRLQRMKYATAAVVGASNWNLSKDGAREHAIRDAPGMVPASYAKTGLWLLWPVVDARVGFWGFKHGWAVKPNSPLLVNTNFALSCYNGFGVQWKISVYAADCDVT